MARSNQIDIGYIFIVLSDCMNRSIVFLVAFSVHRQIDINLAQKNLFIPPASFVPFD